MSTSFKSAMERLKSSIRDVPDFPKPGIVFKDITPILSNGQLFRLAVTIFAERYQRKSVEKIVAIDARGFIFGGALAHYLGIGLSIVRKKGKLPYESHSHDYELEYGQGTLELHVDGVEKNQRVVIIDDPSRHRWHGGSGGRSWWRNVAAKSSSSPFSWNSVFSRAANGWRRQSIRSSAR